MRVMREPGLPSRFVRFSSAAGSALGPSDGGLEHPHYDTFRAVSGNRVFGKSVTFVIDGSTKVTEMTMEHLTDFRRVAVKPDSAARHSTGAAADGAESGAAAHSTELNPFPKRSALAARGTSRSLPTWWR